jgi:acyl carrier protein
MSDQTIEVDTRLRTVIGDILSVEPAALEETSRFVEVYGGDSMLSIEVLAQVEREFQIEIPEENLPRLVNLTGVREVLNEILAAQAN